MVLPTPSRSRAIPAPVVSHHPLLTAIDRVLKYDPNHLSILFAKGNCALARQRMVRMLQQRYRAQILEVNVQPTTTALYSTIQAVVGDRLHSPLPHLILITGLEHNQRVCDLLRAMNHMREEFRKLRCPVVMIGNDQLASQMLREIPDFASWCRMINV